MQKRIPKLLLTLPLVTLLTGCGTSAPPDVEIHVQQQSIPVVQGSYCWSDKCVDKIDYASLLKETNYNTPTVSTGSKLSFDFAAQPKKDVALHLIQNHELTEVDIQQNSFTIPEQAGTYLYVLSGRWNQGSSDYVFQIKVQ